jgi:hypothetical protein
MTLEEIFNIWKEDCEINPSELGYAALELAKLHQKYYKFLSFERLNHKKLQGELKKLRLEKQEFFLDGPTESQIQLGWKLPSKGRILKSDVNAYIEGDDDIIKLNLKIAYQAEKVELLTDIIKTISNRGFHIKSAIDWARFQTGA